MNRRVKIWIGLLISSSILAFFLRDVVYAAVVVPLSYLVALIAFYYSFVPQLIVWILMLVILAFIFLAAFTPEGRFVNRRAVKAKPIQGSVESLARWMVKGREGIYFKWLIAHRLGRLNRELGENTELDDRFVPGKEAIKEYLDVGLNKSFADYPRPANPFINPLPTPLDLNPKEVIDYLESKLAGQGPTTLE